MSEFNFKSAICTSREQSEKLLALGLKKETADCFLMLVGDLGGPELYTIRFGTPYEGWVKGVIPAWSLGRLLELIKHSDICNYNDFGCIKLYIDLDDFETCITMILYMVKEGYFNKEYLVNQTEIEEHCKGVLEYLDYIREEE